MLSLLHIENIAVIEKVDIAFGPGFNVLTGETGAGKSIIIDAIGALLGQRVGRELIRSGCRSGLVSGCFTDLAAEAVEALAAMGYETEDGELLIRREMLEGGKNLCQIGGRPATMAILRDLAPVLLQIHGQHDSQILQKEDRHLSLLDRYADVGELLTGYQSAYGAYRDAERALSALQMDEAEKERRMEMLRFQVDEIDGADLKEGEEESLLDRRRLLQGAEKILSALDRAYSLLLGDEDRAGALDNVSDAARELSAAARYGENLQALYEGMEDARYRLDDLSSDLRRMREEMEFSPGELDEVEGRLDLIHRLKRKYGADVLEVLSYRDKAAAELSAMESAEEEIARQEARRSAALAAAAALAERLSDKRRAAAEELSQAVTASVRQLDMKSARFVVSLSSGDGPEKLTKTGWDQAAFLLSANAGEPPKALVKIASGGELSRVMLALLGVCPRPTRRAPSFSTRWTPAFPAGPRERSAKSCMASPGDGRFCASPIWRRSPP